MLEYEYGFFFWNFAFLSDVLSQSPSVTKFHHYYFQVIVLVDVETVDYVITAAKVHYFILAISQSQLDFTYFIVFLLLDASQIDDLDGNSEFGLVIHAFVYLTEAAFPNFLENIVSIDDTVAYLFLHGDEFLVREV